MKMIPVILSIAMVLVLAGCGEGLTGSVVSPEGPGELTSQPSEPDVEFTEEPEGVEFTDEPEEPAEEPADVAPEEPAAPEDLADGFEGVVLEFTEGDLIDLNPEAIDPDGDRVTYAFSEPLSREGKWQTKIGDEGRYLMRVTASDSKLETEESVLLIIRRANRPPVIQCQDRAVLNEGEKFFVGDFCEVTDEDDEEVVVYYGGWPGYSRYTTTYDDSGLHTLFITASDKIHEVKGELEILVVDVNRKPEFSADFPEKIVGVEGDVITIDTSGVTDPDGDGVTFTFSEPFTNKGVWKTEIGDAGNYDVDVVANDGDASIKRSVDVEILQANTKPQLKKISDIEVDEGETIKLPISATDREGDKLTIQITGWMTKDTYTTNYDDAGEYTVKITVSDGEHVTSQVVHITVNDVNRPPYFVTPA